MSLQQAPFIERRYRFSGKTRMQKNLGPELSSVTRWSATSSGVKGELGRIFEEIGGGHKWIHYLPIYESIIDRSRPIRILEIGVFRGNSLKLWREYLDSDSVIVGVDIDPACKQFQNEAGNVHVRIGSQQDLVFLQRLVDEFGLFDVIIDDGSHMTSHMTDTFRFLFRSGLADTGVYIVEDLHSNYWTYYRDSRSSFMDFVATLVDAMHAHYFESESEIYFRTGHPERKQEIVVPSITPVLGSIEIHDSLVAVRKAVRDLPRTIYQ